MKDLVQVFKVLNTCADRVSEQPRYEPFIVEILKICSVPFLQEKSSDELVFEQIVTESISQIGNIVLYIIAPHFLGSHLFCCFFSLKKKRSNYFKLIPICYFLVPNIVIVKGHYSVNSCLCEGVCLFFFYIFSITLLCIMGF